MGRVAERMADIVVVTDDNPRNEPGDQIITEIVAGMSTAPRVIRDRATAIRTAVAEANQTDVVLVAGKGHEEYQSIGDQRLIYSDRQTVRNILEAIA